jgi:hypothetical protein
MKGSFAMEEPVMIYRGHVKNGVVVLDKDVRLPDGTEVKVEAVEPVEDTPRKTLAERFRNVIGVADDLPADMAENHDHYIHGTPKQT